MIFLPFAAILALLLSACSSGGRSDARRLAMQRYEPCYATNPDGLQCETRDMRRAPAPPRLRTKGNDLDALIEPIDYPAAALRNGESGTVRLRLTIGVDGRIADCRVVHSSGSPALDRGTCGMLQRRGRFWPAVDSNGERVAASIDHVVTWSLPRPIR